jgi:hypothetical protein
MGKVLLSRWTVAMLSRCCVLWADAAGKAFTALSFGLFETSLFFPRRTIVLSMGFTMPCATEASFFCTRSDTATDETGSVSSSPFVVSGFSRGRFHE